MLINVVVNAVAIAVSGSYSIDVMSGMRVDLLTDAFTNGLAAITIGVLSDISVDVLADANVNAFVGVMIAESVMPSPSEGFSC